MQILSTFFEVHAKTNATATLPLLKYLAIKSAVTDEDGVTWLAEEAGVKKSNRRRGGISRNTVDWAGWNYSCKQRALAMRNAALTSSQSHISVLINDRRMPQVREQTFC